MKSVIFKQKDKQPQKLNSHKWTFLLSPNVAKLEIFCIIGIGYKVNLATEEVLL